MSALAAPPPSLPPDDRQTEARRQACLLAAIQGQSPPHPETSRPETHTWQARGLALHKAHARATACATLKLSHPTVEQVLGAEAFEAVAWRLWQTAPPESGDLGDWGCGLPALLAQLPALQPWPWLPDLARLDHARHRCERAADQTGDLHSLSRLADTDPTRLHLRLQEHVMVIPSPWPLAAIWVAHQPGGDLDALAWRLTQVGPASGASPTSVTLTVVWRQPWRAEADDLKGPDAWWLHALVQSQAEGHPGLSLSALLDMAPPGFDFAAWLALALQRRWLAEVGMR